MNEFVFDNMPPEAQAALRGGVVIPTNTDALRLAGIEIDGMPPLTIDELIGPTTLGELDRSHQAFYLSGPKHPILEKARRSPTFVTYQDLLAVRGGLGIRQEMVTKNFKGLTCALFEDEAIPTFGELRPYHFDRASGLLHRVAIRRGMAQRAMRGEYRVGISGTQDTHIFNGYGRALIQAVYNPVESRQRLGLTMELEAMPDLVREPDDPTRFDWGKQYKDDRGIGYRMSDHYSDGPIMAYLEGLLVEIGAIKKDNWRTSVFVSEEAFVLAVNALCSLDTKHTKTIKNGEACHQGVHSAYLTSKAVQRAKTIAGCIAAGENRPPAEEEEALNLDDPGLLSAPKSKIVPVAATPDW